MTGKKNLPDADRPATLKMLAEYLDLSPAAVSIVLNNSPVATSIPAATKQRVHAAAKKFDYRPNLHARMLRSRLTNTIGIIAPELSEGYFNPRLTTVRQPLYKMGAAAAELLIKRILSPDEPYPHDVWFEPELIVRESTMGVHEASTPRPSRGKR